MLVQPLVDGRGDHGHFGVFAAEPIDTLRRGHQAHQLQVAGSGLLQALNGRHRRAGRGQHGVQHDHLPFQLTSNCKDTDQATAALIMDLKARGLLDETLVIWGGEFGRTVTRDNGGNPNPGRDHNGRGFSTWLAGGGVKGGLAYGATNEFGDRAVDNKVHVHDLHATILALLGFEHTKLTYRYNGRDFRLTDNYGNIVTDIIA